MKKAAISLVSLIGLFSYAAQAAPVSLVCDPKDKMADKLAMVEQTNISAIGSEADSTDIQVWVPKDESPDNGQTVIIKAKSTGHVCITPDPRLVHY